MTRYKPVMPEPDEHFIETAVRPFSGNAEEQLAAAELLRQNAPHSASLGAAMARRWDEVDGKKSPAWWKPCLYGVLLITWGFCGFSLVKAFSTYHGLIQWLKDRGLSTPPTPSARFYENLTPEQQLLIGAPHRPAIDQRRLLWESEPENPAYFANYSQTFVQETQTLPPGYLNTARQLDPGNAWFVYFAAAVTSHESVEPVRSSKSGDPSGVREWTILDESRMDEALALFRAARELPVYNSYNKEMMERRLRILPDTDPADRLTTLSYLFSTPSSIVSFLRLGQTVAAKAWQLGEQGDSADLRDLILDVDAFFAASLDHSDLSVIDELVGLTSFSIITENLRASAEKLGMEEAPRLARIHEQLKYLRDERTRRGKESSPDPLQWRADHLTGMNFQHLNHQAAISVDEEDLKPGRMIERAYLFQIGLFVSALMLATGCGVATLYRFRSSHVIHLLAKRMEALLTWKHWLWFLTAGILLPFGYVMTIAWFTPLSGSGWSFHGTRGLLPASHFLTLLLLMLALPILIARRGLARGMELSSVQTNHSWFGWAAILAGLAFIPLVGHLAPLAHGKTSFVKASWILPGALAFWIAGTAFRAVFSSSRKLLARSTVSRMVMPAYACGSLLLLAVAPFFQASISYWFSKESMIKPAAPGFTVYENRVAAAMREELREAVREAAD